MKRRANADLSHRTAAGRWARLGPYYAMFPIPFVESVIKLYAEPGQTVIDPFCGRGTVPFIAMVNGYNAIGCDINPVAWLYSKSKTAPHEDLDDVKSRIDQLIHHARPGDRVPANEFQGVAFCEDALAFINSARRELCWKTDSLDRTVAALLLQYLHDKLGHGLSNQMRHSRALSPRYCIDWWRKKGLSTPPPVDVQSFMHKRVEWRYAKGVPSPRTGQTPIIALGDAASVLPEDTVAADLVLTSPPYSNVTNYRTDNWLRLWALDQGPNLPDWNSEQKFANPKNYKRMLTECLTETKKRTHPETVWYVRSDARVQTRRIISSVMHELLPNHRTYENPAPYPGDTQTVLYGDRAPKPGEIDLLFLPPGKRRRGFARTFKPISTTMKRYEA